MKIISWNVNGIRASAKKGFWEYFEAEDADIFCIQETKAHPDQLDASFLNRKGKTSYYSSGRKKGYSGTATYVKSEPSEVTYGLGIKKFDLEGRFVVVEYPEFTLFNVYFPNGGMSEERHNFKQEFLKKFAAHLKRLLSAGKEVIVLGDYNVAYLDIDVHDPAGLSGASGFLPEERQWFKDFLDMGFTDVYRHFYPDRAEKYTWWSYKERARPANRGWRIDHICVSSGLIDKVKSMTIVDDQEGSDHCPIKMEIEC